MPDETHHPPLHRQSAIVPPNDSPSSAKTPSVEDSFASKSTDHRDQDQASLDWRPRSLLTVVLLFWLILAGRLIQLQWIDRADFAARTDRQRSYYETIPARPGEIVDRHGRLLATTITVKSLYLVPQQVSRPWELSLELSESLNIDSDRLFERLTRHHDKQFLWVKRRLTDEEVERVKQLKLPARSWGFRDEYLRRYPQGALAAHVIGLRDIDGTGRGGVEQSFNAQLKGRPGRRKLVRDARGRVIEVHHARSRMPQHGRTVVLSLDAVVQLYTERELDQLMETWKPASACAIVIDPGTSEILALASRPAFDPNQPVDVPAHAWKNTALAAVYEPGSTFKPFVVAWGLEQELIRRDEVFHCEHGKYRMGRRLLHDTHPYGELSITDILVKSSNIGMAKIGERMTNEQLYRAAINFGFGNKTGIDLPGELSGILRPLNQWNSYSTGSIPMGQELAVTPLQLITGHAALANGGMWITPRIALKTIDPQRSADDSSAEPSPTPSVVSRTVRADIADWVVQGPMTDVVRRGTGRRAQLAGYTVFGKTGTAQKLDPVHGGYSSDLHVSSFICGAPADDPRVLVLVVVNEPSEGTSQFGGTVAAPTAAQILRRTLIHLQVPSQEASRPRSRG